MTRPQIPLLPLDQRPEFAGRLVRVWRTRHIARGEQLSVIVWPGEWPDSHPDTVADGIPVKHNEVAGGSGGMMVLGRIGKVWRVAYTIASAGALDMSVGDLAIVTAYAEVSDDPDITVWMSPSPTTGEVPMWKMPRPSLQ